MRRALPEPGWGLGRNEGLGAHRGLSQSFMTVCPSVYKHSETQPFCLGDCLGVLPMALGCRFPSNLGEIGESEKLSFHGVRVWGAGSTPGWNQQSLQGV